MPIPRWLPGGVAVVVTLAACAPLGVPSPQASVPREPATGGVVFSPMPSAQASDPGVPTLTPIPVPSDQTSYLVRGGDSLSSIARGHQTTVEQLKAWNADRYPSLVTSPNVIEPGWNLVVATDAAITPNPVPSPATPTPASIPMSTPAPAPRGCTAGNRAAAGSMETFRTIPDAGQAVALTFDMGGRMKPAVDILNFLVANDVCATIFATGAMSRTEDGMAALAIIRQHPELFEVGNHTMFHCDLVSGGGGSPSKAPCVGGPFTADRIRAELIEAEAILREATGQSAQPYWRPPYGKINAEVLAAAASAGYTKTFLWDVDAADWRPIAEGGPTAEQIAAKVITGAVNGSNVLFHLGGYETLDALHLIVPALRDRGFNLTSLSDLLS